MVHAGASDEEVRARWQQVESEIEVLPTYESALEGIDGFSHLMVLYFMHRLDTDARRTLRVKPRGLLRHGLSLDDLPTIGVFACDAPVRPNPIGVSVVQVLGRDGLRLRVKGLDALNGSPVLDLKPYTSDRAPTDLQVPSWHRALLEKTKAPRV
jgi:tRNA-Thr(GGU) m(6)t(6)A37 methyltransferase TsaA